MKLRSLLLGALVCAPLAACASTRNTADLEWDPIEPVNRPIFAFNDGLDSYVLEPVARGWRFVFRNPGMRAVDRFVTNLEFPVRFVGNLLQAELVQSGAEIGRFGVNTTVGVLGFFDPATRFGIGLYDEDLGQAVGSYGLPPGPYLMIPILGPSNPRDFVTGFGDGFVMWYGSIVRNTVGLINSRALLIEDIREAKQASLDYYTFVRNAYVTTREAKVQNRDADAVKPAADEDIYDLEDEEEGEEK
jgi:phospholipid-binding lipoprotein MlaA